MIDVGECGGVRRGGGRARRGPGGVEGLAAVTCDRGWGGWFLVVTPLLYNGYYLL